MLFLRNLWFVYCFCADDNLTGVALFLFCGSYESVILYMTETGDAISLGHEKNEVNPLDYFCYPIDL